MKNSILKLLKGLFIFFMIILFWWIASLNSNPLFVPNPIKVWDDLVIVVKSKMIFTAMFYSFSRITIATILSAVVAIPVGLLIFNVKIIREILYPITNVLRYLPVTAFYQLLIMWFGIEEKMKIAFLFIATFVYMMPSVILCLDEIRQDLLDTGKTLGMNQFQIITKIQIPYTLPSIMNSFIMMYGIGFTYISVAETVNARYGLGYIIQQSSSRGRTDMVFMAIIAIVLISILFDYIANKLVHIVFYWRYINNE